MTRAEYMEKLQEKLEQFNRGLQKEIIEDYEQHFDEGLAAGRTEEEIIDELGSIEDMVQEFSQEDYVQMPAVCGDGTSDGGDGQSCTGGTADNADGQGCRVNTSDDAVGQSCGVSISDGAGGQSYEGCCKAIVLENVCADVTVCRSKDDRVRVQYYGNGDRRYRFYRYEKDQTLYVGLRPQQTEHLKSFLAFGKTIFAVLGSGKCGSFELEIPEHFSSVQISSASGDVELDGVSAEKLTLSAASGDYVLLHNAAAQLTIQTASGDVEISDTAAENGAIRTGSGDVTVSGLRGKRLTVATGSGDVMVSGLRGEKLTVATGSGTVELCAGIKSCTVKTGSGDVQAELEGADSVTIGTANGDVELSLTGTAGIDLNATSVNGQLEVTGYGQVESGRRYQKLLNGDGSCKVEVSTSNGDVQISCP